MSRPFTLCGVPIYPGETREVELLVSELYTTSPVAIPIRVVRGWEDGPRLFVTAAVHGDEINGTEVIRELDTRGIEMDDIGLRRPTLDDVFLSLTGHVAEEKAEENGAGKAKGKGKEVVA